MKDKDLISSRIMHFIFTGTTLHFSLKFIGIVVAGEMIAMFIGDLLPPQSPFITALLHSFFLLIISFPILYFFVLRKLKNQIIESQHASLALSKSESLYHTLVDKIPDGVYKSTHDGKFVDANPSMVAMLGYESKEELMAIDIKSQLYFNPGDRESLVLGQNQKEMSIYRLKKKDGSAIWVEDHGWYSRGENGEILFHEGILRDITYRIQAERDLKNERLLLRTVIDNIPDSIYCKDTAGRKTLVNLTELQYSRTTSESEIIGKTDFDLYPKELAEAFFADDQLVLQTGQPVLNREEFVLDNKGMKRWLLTSKLPMKDEYGNITGIIGIGRDVTNRRQTEEELRENEINLKVILQSTADGILAVNGNGKIIKTNKRFAELWRIPQELIDLGDYDKLMNLVQTQLTNPEDFISKVKKLSRSTDENLDHLYFRDGRVYERFSAPLDLPNSAIGRVWSFRDITERIRTESEIKLKNEKLSSINAQKDKFFSIIAHDLKSPFNSIMGFSELLTDQIKEKDYEGIDEYAKIIGQSSKRAMDLLMNLLEWARSQTGRMEFNPKSFELVDLIEENMMLFDAIAGQKAITINKVLPNYITVFADKPMISTVLRNLISNAIKFTGQGGEIEISAEKTTNEILVSVKDNGIGIASDRIGNVFRIDASESTPGTNNEKGTGLGLILCKEFVDKHGGKIWAESQEGKGSTFTFLLNAVNL